VISTIALISDAATIEIAGTATTGSIETIGPLGIGFETIAATGSTNAVP